MPQLSPLNWIFLFITFWSVIAIMSTIIWWYSKTSFQLMKSSSPNTSKSNKWNW